MFFDDPVDAILVPSSVRTGTVSQGVEQSGCQVSYSSPSSFQVTNECSYTSNPLICLHDMDKQTLNFIIAFQWLWQ